MNTYEYSKTSTLTQNVNISKLEQEIKDSEILTSLMHLNLIDGTIQVLFESELTLTENNILDALVENHEHITTPEYLRDYLNNEVHPASRLILDTFTAENIAMGITQAGKVAPLLAMFVDKVPNLNVSLKDCFDTGSLYAAMEVLFYHETNIANYSNLSPFVTLERLQEMRAKIAAFLGV